MNSKHLRPHIMLDAFYNSRPIVIVVALEDIKELEGQWSQIYMRPRYFITTKVERYELGKEEFERVTAARNRWRERKSADTTQGGIKGVEERRLRD